ncbi:MAG: two-component regulator propeller domain-containing protein [Acidobacteriota bacterium]
MIVCLVACMPAWAQRHSFKFYGEEEGLRNLGVQVVVQDRTGFLWVGTQNGLYRYDGIHFTEYSKAAGLPGTRIESLHEAADGTLWVGTRSGLARRVRDHFEAVTMGPTSNVVARGVLGRQGIATDAKGNLYLTTERGLVRGVRKQDGFEFSVMPTPESQKDEVSVSVFLDGAGKVWFGCGTGLCLLENGAARDVAVEMGLPTERWFSILSNVDGDLWVRGDQHLYRRRAGNTRFEALTGVPSSSNTFPTAAIDPDGRLLVPTDKGLARETAKGWELINVEDDANSDDISSVLLDREGSIWLGLTGSGLARWLGYGEWQSWTQRDGLSRSSVWSVTKDREGRLWAGTRFGLNYAVEKDGKLVWKQQPTPGVEWARSLAPAADGGCGSPRIRLERCD